MLPADSRPGRVAGVLLGHLRAPGSAAQQASVTDGSTNGHKTRICAQTHPYRDESGPIAWRLGEAKNRATPLDCTLFQSVVAVLLAMQKVVGSSPISRFAKSR